MPPENEFIQQVCRLKHDNLDKDIFKIKEDVEEVRKTEESQHEEIKKMISTLTREVRSSHKNLKNKIILSEKSMGDKIDALNDFDESLKGNGNPGIWENVRNIKRNVKITMVAMAFLFLLLLGGNYRGVSLQSIKNVFGIGKDKINQVEVVTEEYERTEEGNNLE